VNAAIFQHFSATFLRGHSAEYSVLRRRTCLGAPPDVPLGLHLFVEPLHRLRMQGERAIQGATVKQRLPAGVAFGRHDPGEDESGVHQSLVIVGELLTQSESH
jgi:hypothetical protein